MADIPSEGKPVGTYFSMGFGAAVLFEGSVEHPPRLRMVTDFLKEEGEGLSVLVPNLRDGLIAQVCLGNKTICLVREGRNKTHEYHYRGTTCPKRPDELSMLTAQISAMVHETLMAQADYNPLDYAGTIPTGVQ